MIIMSLDDKRVIAKMTFDIKERIRGKSRINIVCIGTDKLVGDSLGPLVGSMLSDGAKLKDTKIIGTLEKPLHGLNISERLKELEEDAFVIAVDASIGDIAGSFQISNKPIKPGLGLRKELPYVGDLSIKGNTINTKQEGILTEALSNVRLGEIYKMAKIISISLNNAINSN